MDHLKGLVRAFAENLDLMPPPAVALPEPPVPAVPIPFDDQSLTPWTSFRHLGAPDEVTVVHDSDRIPYLVKLSECL